MSWPGRKRRECCEPGPILLCMGLFSRFCVWALRCTADEYLHCVRDTSYRLIDSTPTHPALARAEPDARAQKLLRVDGIAVDARFVMQMRAGGATGGADGADHLSDLDDIANPDVNFRKVPITCRQPVAVVDLHHAAIAAHPARGR